MKDLMKQHRKILRPGWCWEFKGKNDKKVNRRIARKRLKADTRKEVE